MPAPPSPVEWGREEEEEEGESMSKICCCDVYMEEDD